MCIGNYYPGLSILTNKYKYFLHHKQSLFCLNLNMWVFKQYHGTHIYQILPGFEKSYLVYLSPYCIFIPWVLIFNLPFYFLIVL